ncbi:hypothetical protein [Hydrogenophilus thiooxidans]|uniref:hypothetical protein n=1 Tax=Hydrogenophilus thiooxidans TaxID=2820326 RepID=UPI001C248026|nr:hypothetical protein [Hydrogenophilus thiooxidans]
MSIAGFGIIGPTGERLNTSAASPAEVQRLTQPQPVRSNPAAGQPSSVNQPSQPSTGVRVTLSTSAQQASSGTPTPPPPNTASSARPEATQMSFAVQRAQNLYALNANGPVSMNDTTQNGAKTLR